MPAEDGTGPQGAGPLTGRGAGNCATPSQSVPASAEAQGQPVGGLGLLRYLNPFRWFGRGRGRGDGRGRRAQR